MITYPQLIRSLLGTVELKRGAKPGKYTYRVDDARAVLRHPDLRGVRRALLLGAAYR